MVALLALDDGTHPNKIQTQENATSMLLRIPLEIRLKIFEEAIEIPGLVQPQRVSYRSNIFFPQPRRPWLKNEMPMDRLVIVDLLRTCRQFYLELESNPVFYRLNTFAFHSDQTLFNFLVALTPARRSMIKTIKIYHHFADVATGFMLEDGIEQRRLLQGELHCQTMLSRCSNLRTLEFVEVIGRKHRPQVPVNQTLKNLHEWMDRHGNYNSIWDIPFSKLTITANTDTPEQIKLHIPFLHPDDKSTHVPSSAHGQQIDDLAHRLSEAIIARRGRCAEASKHSAETPYTEMAVHNALAFSVVDFPGEVRISHDRFNTTFGAVSSRTRQKCKGPDAITAAGTLTRTLSRYNAEGLLIHDMFKVCNMRWKDSSIECLIESWDKKQNWESIYAILTRNGIESLRLFYKMTSAKKSWDRPLLRLREIENMPSPKNVFDIVHSSLADLSEASRNKNIRLWNKGKDDYMLMILRLKQATEQAVEPVAKAKARNDLTRRHSRRSVGRGGERKGDMTGRERMD